jgi:hypothetical protein
MLKCVKNCIGRVKLLLKYFFNRTILLLVVVLSEVTCYCIYKNKKILSSLLSLIKIIHSDVLGYLYILSILKKNLFQINNILK